MSDRTIILDEIARPEYFAELTDQQWRFARLVVELGDYIAASQAAGYRTSFRAVRKMLADPKMRDAIVFWMTRAGITPREVQSRIASIARGDIGLMLDDDGNFDINRARQLGLTHLIKRYRVYENRAGRRVEVELYDALQASIALAKMMGMMVEVTQNNIVVYIPDNGRRPTGEVVDARPG